MSPGDDARGPFSLKRWSQRKLASARAASTALERESSAPAMDRTAPPAPSSIASAPPSDGSLAPPAIAAAPQPPALPPVESLNLASDFTPFLQPQVEESLRRQALRRLFRDPHFNVMDGLDVYIDDYSRPDPLPAEVARQLVQARYVLDPPATRVNADGVVEDVPREAIGPPAPDGKEATAGAGVQDSTTANSEPTTAIAAHSPPEPSPASNAAQDPIPDAAAADRRPGSTAAT